MRCLYWEYSNYGFVLLGILIEKASGEGYYEYVRKHIYDPAGMTSTGSEPEDQPVADRSVGYTKTGSQGQWHQNIDTTLSRDVGGGRSTVEDLLRFANALQNHKLLNANYTELLTTGKVDTPRGRYGYGFGDQTINGTRCFGHDGGAPGMNGDLEICPGPGYVIAVLSNMDPLPQAASRVLSPTGCPNGEIAQSTKQQPIDDKNVVFTIATARLFVLWGGSILPSVYTIPGVV